MAFPNFKKSRSVYLDYGASTPLAPAVLGAMRPYLADRFANPSALYQTAAAARAALDHARQAVAEILHTQSDSIIFTSNGTESCNLAVLGACRKNKSSRVSNTASRHIITTKIEHHAVLNPVNKLEQAGWRATYLKINEEGFIDRQALKNALNKDTRLVSIQYANNEIGTIQPIAAIGRELLKWRKQNGTAYPYFHTDGCQAASYLDLNVEKLHVDLMSLNGSKLYGPKGIGLLYKRRGVELEPLTYGGGQEFGLRSGTENVAGMVGMARALELVEAGKAKEGRRVETLRNYFWQRLKKEVKGVKLNGPAINSKFKIQNSKLQRLPNNLNVIFPGTDAEALIIYLDEAGIQCSSGSACTTDSDEVSHVLLACGLGDEARSSIRFTLGRETTKRDIQYVMRYLPKVIEHLRRASAQESLGKL